MGGKVIVLVTVPEAIDVNQQSLASQPIEEWRRGRDLNSRSPYEDSGFQDRHVRPLRHPSEPVNGVIGQ